MPSNDRKNIVYSVHRQSEKPMLRCGYKEEKENGNYICSQWL